MRETELTRIALSSCERTDGCPLLEQLEAAAETLCFLTSPQKQ
jgi:hypothetical protein